MAANIDSKTVKGFGEEWSRFTQDQLQEDEYQDLCDRYFKIFPWSRLPAQAQGFDMGCGSGRFASYVAPKVHKLYCIDASEEALEVSKQTLKECKNCEFLHTSVDGISLKKYSMDFGYSLGVLHHIPNTQEGLQHCVDLLKPGAPFLLYLYYSFDNRPPWFQHLWLASETVRKSVSSLPFFIRKRVTDMIALGVYFPLAKSAWLLEKLGKNIENFPLSAYRHNSFYTLRTDALDRFGTRLEQRFSREEIKAMMEQCGLERIKFSDDIPYWVAVGFKRA